jgi:pyruvate kinase
VANAVLDGADCVMLSGETANGDFPNDCVQIMDEICCEAEQAIWNDSLFRELVKLTPQPTSTTETVAAAAVNASFQQNIAAIVVLSTSGASAAWVSKYRPRCPILCVTRSERGTCPTD